MAPIRRSGKELCCDLVCWLLGVAFLCFSRPSPLWAQHIHIEQALIVEAIKFPPEPIPGLLLFLRLPDGRVNEVRRPNLLDVVGRVGVDSEVLLPIDCFSGGRVQGGRVNLLLVPAFLTHGTYVSKG